MKKSFPLSYRSKKRRINEELEAHYKSLQDNSFFIDDSIDNINNSPSNLLHTTENNIVETNNNPNNNDFVSDDSLTNNINKL